MEFGTIGKPSREARPAVAEALGKPVFLRLQKRIHGLAKPERRQGFTHLKTALLDWLFFMALMGITGFYGKGNKLFFIHEQHAGLALGSTCASHVAVNASFTAPVFDAQWREQLRPLALPRWETATVVKFEHSPAISDVLKHLARKLTDN